MKRISTPPTTRDLWNILFREFRRTHNLILARLDIEHAIVQHRDSASSLRQLTGKWDLPVPERPWVAVPGYRASAHHFQALRGSAAIRRWFRSLDSNPTNQ